MAKAWRDVPGLVWDGSGANPYFGFLDAADVILVTEESANMATEAAATGKPVYLLSLPGRPGKFARFHDDLIGAGIARRFDGELERWTYAPLVETDRAAAEILRRMRARTPV